ncbi:MAG: polyphenol oxidase family protein, partial [Actinomycetaceae bacterium]|nr:polyphenol oxidase family protein [Actinomycetaceae bacterium]
GEIFDDTDALVIDLDRIGEDRAAACVMVADCIPLVLLSTTQPQAAVVHVGRAGFMSNIAAKVVDMLGSDLVAVVGPSICGACYEVGEEMRAQAAEVASDAACVTSWGSPAIDIRAGLAQQLREAGVTDIQRIDRCTNEDDDYFSYRRACREADGRTGRFVGIAMVERV